MSSESDELGSDEEPYLEVGWCFRKLIPVRVEGAPEVSARWSGTLRNIVKLEKHLGKGGSAEVWYGDTVYLLRDVFSIFCDKQAASRLDIPLNESPDATSGSKRHGRSPNKPSHTVFAAKIISTYGRYRGTASGITTSEELEEARLIMSLSHQYVIKCYGAFHDESFLVLFTEYGRGGDVRRLLRESGKLTREESLSITRQILDAVRYIHSENIIHRDIKPGNIFYKYDRKTFEDKERDRSKSHEAENSYKYTVFLGDFGSAVKTVEGLAFGYVGSTKYMAPEVLLAHDDTDVSKLPYEATIDIWSLGITAYKLMTNKQPQFDHRTIESLGIEELTDDDYSNKKVLAYFLAYNVQKIVARRFENDVDVQQFLLGCLVANPNERKADASILNRALSKGADLERRTTVSERHGKGIRKGPKGEWKGAINTTKAARASQQQDSDEELENRVSRINIQDKSKRPEKKDKDKGKGKVSHRKVVR